MSAAALEIAKVKVAFGGAVALADASLRLGKAELLGLIGPNGSGKTSLCNVISGLYTADSGTVRKGEVSLLNRKPHEIAALGVARTFQGIEVFGHMSVLDNVLLGRHVRWRRTRALGHLAVAEKAISLLD